MSEIPDEVHEIAGLIDQLSYRNMRFLASGLCSSIGEDSVVDETKLAEALAAWAENVLEVREDEKAS